MAVDVHAHLYPRAFMEGYTPAFWNEDARLREMDAAGVERQALSLGPPMTYWAPPDFMLEIGALKSRIPYDKLVTNEYLPR